MWQLRVAAGTESAARRWTPPWRSRLVELVLGEGSSVMVVPARLLISGGSGSCLCRVIWVGHPEFERGWRAQCSPFCLRSSVSWWSYPNRCKHAMNNHVGQVLVQGLVLLYRPLGPRFRRRQRCRPNDIPELPNQTQPHRPSKASTLVGLSMPRNRLFRSGQQRIVGLEGWLACQGLRH